MGVSNVVIDGFVAGLFASLACGLGALPLLFKGLNAEERVGLGYAFAGGLMISASVYNLLLPAMTIGSAEASELISISKIVLGLFGGCALIWWVNAYLDENRLKKGILKYFGSKSELLIFVAMAFHSIPEGVAVGVGYGSQSHLSPDSDLGFYIAVAIAIHNIPEGLAIALPMRANGATIARCSFFAFLTSLPQPIAAVPASMLVWFFEPLMLPLLGFAAGSMMYLVLVELLPQALKTRTPAEVAWSFMTGFALMALVQAGLS